MAKIKIRNSDNHHGKPRGTSKDSFEKVYWPYIPLAIVISGLLMLSNSGGALRAASKHPFGNVLSYATSMSIGNLLADTNSARAANGVGNLKLDDKLDAAAQANADDMAARNYWSHYTPEGNPPWIWATNQGYSYTSLAQNLAAGFNDEHSTVNGWMASPPHRENLLNSTYTDVGFGYANNPNYTSAGGGPMTIVVAFYGKPQVLAAATSQPSSELTAPAATASNSSPDAATPNPVKPAVSSSAASPQSSAASKDPSSKKANTPAVTTSYLDLAVPKTAHGQLATKISLILGLGLGIFWLSRHLRAIKRLFLEGERYAVGHPVTDLGMVIIACLLFIISQTAGIIR